MIGPLERGDGVERISRGGLPFGEWTLSDAVLGGITRARTWSRDPVCPRVLGLLDAGRGKAVWHVQGGGLHGGY